MTMRMILEHVSLVFAASLLAVAVGLPLGVAAYVAPRARNAILRLSDLLQTIPALALLGMIMVVAGAGKKTVIIGLMRFGLPLCFDRRLQNYLDIPVGLLLLGVVIVRSISQNPNVSRIFASRKQQKAA